jgi:hypothetical protein
MTRRERLENKLEKRQEWAEKAQDRAANRFTTVDRIVEHIPFGQPILVGHHSEKHARKDQARVETNMHKGVEELNLAKHHAQKADGLASQLKRTVFSDDDNAIEALEARIAKAEELQKKMREANKLVRKYKNDIPAGVAALGKAGFSLTVAAQCFVPDFCGRLGFPGYALTNNSARIRKDKERIKQIQAQNARTEQAEAAGGVVISGDDYVRVTFAEKPEYEIIRALKAADFRWSGGSWFGSRAKLPQGLTA